MVDDVAEILQRHRADNTNLYVMGFSKGGLGAFQIAAPLGARAMVAIDAAPMNFAPKEAVDKYQGNRDRCPFWAIYTNYDDEQSKGYRPLAEFNELLTANVHHGIADMPPAGARVRTLVQAPPDRKTPVSRHVGICDDVSRSVMPYQWLLQPRDS